ncbi:hypothetical protein EUGRSUZ_L00827 [Eucalyptus grandis]|uniref:Uncharacterized protein n=1 Tax=Eucalyptus grandis TaxID=71139 RepID=A0A058ZVL1_EUCGR|nr:hypothetical protein EUGRSUZ_L00827 [Eucalyptus grandis]
MRFLFGTLCVLTHRTFYSDAEGFLRFMRSKQYPDVNTQLLASKSSSNSFTVLSDISSTRLVIFYSLTNDVFVKAVQFVGK